MSRNWKLIAALTATGVAAIGLFILTTQASGNHRVNTTYTGTNDHGGVVDFEVETDGFSSWVSRFHVSDPEPAPNCPSESEASGLFLPIDEDHTFSQSAGFSFEGGFPADGQAEGTFSHVIPPSAGFAGCDSGDVGWTASATGGEPAPTAPLPPPGDINCDYVIDGEDLILLLSYDAVLFDGQQDYPCPDLAPAEPPYIIAWADLNCDFSVDVIDALIDLLLIPDPPLIVAGDGCIDFP